MRAAVIGLGKIGLPLAVQIAGRGIVTTGVDINPDVVEAVRSGQPPFPGEPDLEERLQAAIEAELLSVTTSTGDAVASADVVIVVVPLIVDATGTPDFRSIDSATDAVGRALRPGQLVVYETTLPIGTTKSRFGAALESLSGLEAGQEFHLAFSPERVSSGSVFRDLRAYPKLVGGINATSEEMAVGFYSAALEFDERPDLDRPNGVWTMGSTEAAEFVKLAETTYRDVNIALANEFASHAWDLGLDAQAIFDAANSQPYSHIHRPGISVGGHCIPVYPHFYMASHLTAQLPFVARQVNRSQPARYVDRLQQALGGLEGHRVLVLGAAYRAGVKESAFSGVFDLVSELESRGAEVQVVDPLFSDSELAALGLPATSGARSFDAVILHTDHPQFADFSPSAVGAQVMVDGRGAFDRGSQLIVP